MSTARRRFAVLPRQGTLLVSGDLHGNGSDWRALVRRFEDESARDPQTIWVLLGDAVHGPSDEARTREPALYDYPDESSGIVEDLARLQREAPGRVLYLLGNHDFAHVGGPKTSKFHSDEAAHLETRLSRDERERLKAFFRHALLAAAAPCGVFLSHGSPDDRLRAVEELDAIELPPREARHWELLTPLLTSYGQAREVTERLLAVVGKVVPGVRMVIHGHDRDPAGWFTEGGNQGCPVLFGAPRGAKRFLRLDLAARYERVEDLRDGVEIVRLHE